MLVVHPNLSMARTFTSCHLFKEIQLSPHFCACDSYSWGLHFRLCLPSWVCVVPTVFSSPCSPGTGRRWAPTPITGFTLRPTGSGVVVSVPGEIHVWVLYFIQTGKTQRTRSIQMGPRSGSKDDSLEETISFSGCSGRGHEEPETTGGLRGVHSKSCTWDPRAPGTALRRVRKAWRTASVTVSLEGGRLIMRMTGHFSGNVSSLHVSLTFSVFFFIILNGSFCFLSISCHLKIWCPLRRVTTRPFEGLGCFSEVWVRRLRWDSGPGCAFKLLGMRDESLMRRS